jgi:signal transduction histidine kinase
MVPGIFVGLRFSENRAQGIEKAINNLHEIAELIGQDLDEKVQGTAQLEYGLARAKDLDTNDRSKCSAFLSAVRDEYPQYTGILTITPEGKLHCDSLKTGRSLDLHDREYFIKASQLKGGVAIEPAFGRLTGLSVLQIAYPARTETGDLKFILLASFNLGKFGERHERQLQNAEILILDRHGTVLVWLGGGNRHEQVGEGSELFRITSASGAPRTAEVEGADGVRRIWATAATSPEIRDAGLHILVGRQKSDLSADANRRLLEDLGTLAAVSVLLFASVWILAELSIRRQVGRISAMVTRLGQGELGARMSPPFPKGELGELMSNLNGTAAAIERQNVAIGELNQKLSQAQKMEAVGQLTGGIAHDFNNLLTVILGNAEILAESLTQDPTLRPIAEMTAKAAERGAELTSRLLVFARRQSLDPKAIDINAQIAEMDPLLRRTLGENIEIQVIGTPAIWQALVDPGQLESALLNLCINARDAMPDGGRLTIETANMVLDDTYNAHESEVETGAYVMVAVSDTGVGMDRTTIARAFEPFFTTKGAGKGSGLGLSMVYGFVRQSNGHIRIYSEPGQGTTVKIYLPRASTDEQTWRDIADAPKLQRGNEKILLVEDDDLVREHVNSQLKTLGYQVVAVNDGRRGIEILAQFEDFDLLFTDVTMPGMSGRQLAEEAKKIRPALKVLFTSGFTENAFASQDHQRPAGIPLLQKPYRRQELAAKIRAVLDLG